MRFTQFARGRSGRDQRNKVGMNSTEEAYSEVLRTRQICGEIEWFMFEGVKLRLADNTFYTPDFFVMLSDGTFEAHEVKGFWENAARVKVKVAASLYPIRFIAMKPNPKRAGGGWVMEEF